MSSGMDWMILCVLVLLTSGSVFGYQVENGILGGSVSFHESVPVQVNPIIQWTFKNAIIAQRFPGGTPVCKDQYIGRCDLSENGTLRLDSLTYEDEGNYTMLAQYSNTTNIKQSTFGLRVYNILTPPVLTSNGTNGHLISGTYVSLHCDAGSQIVTTYTFYRDAKNICSEPHVTCMDSNLYFQPITESDRGIYTCTIQNPVSNSTSNTLQLNVFAILTPPVLTSNSTNDRPISDTYVSLHCEAGSQTVTTYNFYHVGQNICSEPHVTCRDSNLYFQPITESDSGSYTCTIQNPVSTNTSNTLQLNVSVRVSDVKITSNISGLVWPGLDSPSLTCSALGTNVSYSWSLQGAPLPQDPQYHLTDNDRVLTISPVSDKDNGTFTCTATNWINNGTSNGVTFNLASAISAVAMTSNTSGSYIWAGEDSVSFHCSADGSVVIFQWKLNGASLPPDSRYHITQGSSPPQSNLTISPVSRNDAGPFTCEASNRISNKTSNALSLNLAWIPEKKIQCTAVPAGSDVELGCSWSGGKPAANVSLVFDGKTDSAMNNVTRVVTTGGNFQGSEFTCLGDQLGRKTECKVRLVLPEAPEHNNDTTTPSNTGDTVVLMVNLVTGLPAEFTWYRLNPDPVPITTNKKLIVESTSSNSRLRIPDVTVADAGKYECRAKNIIGTQSFLFTVTVAKKGLSGGAIAGIVIGVLAGVTLIGVIVFFILKKK